MATEFKIPLHRFDTNLLPPEARQVGTEAFKTAVMLHFAAEYAAQGQTAMVTVDDQEVTVMAFPAESSALDFVLPILKAGKIAEAVPYLESLTKSAPANAAVLYNLGIAYSELGQFDEAVIRLKRAVQLDPGPRARVGRHRQCVPPHAQARSRASSFREGRRSRPQ